MSNSTAAQGAAPATPETTSSQQALPVAIVQGEEVLFRILLPHAETDYIQKRLATEGRPYEPEMLADFRARIEPGELVLDVGANIGNHTLYLAAGGARVVAFEPNAELATALLGSVELNGWTDRVQVRAVGVGHAAGSARFAAARPENLGAQALIVAEDGPVPVVALDALSFDQPVRALKIDVEGMEFDVLQGASALIDRDRPLIYVELPEEEALDAVYAWIVQRGYRLLDTFNVTPTHLFAPKEAVEEPSVAPPQAARDRYALARRLDAMRENLSQSQKKYRESTAGVAALRARLAQAEAAVEAARPASGMDALARRLQAVVSARAPHPGAAEHGPVLDLVESTGAALGPIPAPPPAAELRAACILDEFSFFSFRDEAAFEQLTPEGWRAQLAARRPDMLLVESAWRGEGDLWSRKIGQNTETLFAVLDWCRENGVPTAFWNKEDPVHFTTFLNTAQRFDHVFTTDMDCVDRYRNALGHDRVDLLPFGCQPRRHNPIETFRRKDAVSFAGAYYARYPDRARIMDQFVEELSRIRPFEIFDRNFARRDEHYAFPDRYASFIVGTLPPDAVDYAYKGYRYAVNLNSVTHSQSMFARRVFELMASNTLIVSNYARGLSLMFGNLPIAVDDGAQAAARLAALAANPGRADRLRLAGVRKALSEHAYADRLALIAARLGLASKMAAPPSALMIGAAPDQGTADRLVAAFRAQSHAPRRLVLILGPGARAPEDPAISGLTMAEARRTRLRALAGLGEWVLHLSARDHYGRNYVSDLLLATRYADVAMIGKGEHFTWIGSEARRRVPGQSYRRLDACAARRSAIRADALPNIRLSVLTEHDDVIWRAREGVAVDPWNYCADAAGADPAAVSARVDDLPELDAGLPLAQIEAAARAARCPARAESAGGTAQDTLSTLFAGRSAGTVRVEAAGEGLEVHSALVEGAHQYLYAAQDLSLEALDLHGKKRELRLFLEATPGLRLSLVLLFLDSEGARLGHVIVPANANATAEPTKGTVSVRLGLRAAGPGTAVLRALDFAHRDAAPAMILPRGDVLVVSNHYPSYDDLYRHAFAHSRVRAYRARGVTAEVFRMRSTSELRFTEFEGVEVTSGSAEALDRMLDAGRHRAVFVHFLSEAMWEVLSRHIDRTPVTVWLHGAEIQPWTRRPFDLEDLSETAAEARKKDSDARMVFWRRLLTDPHPNLKLVIVSRSFLAMIEEDLGFRLPETLFEVIHNPIDTALFAYRPKLSGMRRKILSIRPYASHVYGNDLAVEAILRLSEQPFFRDLQFRMIGSGPLFERTLAPLRDFENIVIERRFLRQSEIAEMHADHGVFLCPSRSDTQGVSRDEAMASGLVPVVSAVAAVPEFVNESCGMLTPPEDAAALAEAIATLYLNPERFLRLSAAAAARVRRQSASEIVIDRELALLEDRREPDLAKIEREEPR